MLRSNRSSCVLLFLLITTAATNARGQSVDEIVARNIQAKGGAEKLQSVQSMKLTGRLVAGGSQAPFTIWTKRPNLARQEADVQGAPMVRGFDGTTAWVTMGSQTREVTGPQAAATRDQAEFDTPLLNYASKGNRVELVGTKPGDGGGSLYHLKLTTKSGLVEHFYLDADTALERKTSVTLDQEGQQVTVVSELSDYRDVDGLKMPFSVRQSINGTPLTELTIDKVEVNVPIDDEIFKMPRPKGH
jgi:outer membrane lipoprotein-sorting protein